MKEIINNLIENEIEIFDFDFQNKSLKYFYYNDKVFILHFLENAGEIDKVNDYLIEFSLPENQKEILQKISFSKSDKELKFVDIKAFLWDLYFVVFYIHSEGSSIPEEIISKIERNKFIARKIIIDAENNQKAIEKLNNIVFEINELKKILHDNENIFTTNEIEITNQLLTDEIVNDIKVELQINENPNLSQVSEYLQIIKSNLTV